MEKRVSAATLRQRQSMPLDAKIIMSQRRIKAWHEHYKGRVYVAFSGGKDSMVLLHLVRQAYPNTPGVFVKTGLQYPSVVTLAQGQSNVRTIRPKMTFRQVLDHYGFPVVSKRVAQYVCEVQNSRGETATKRLRLTGIKTNGTSSKMGMIPYKWQYLCDAPFKISDRCCLALKKRPARKAEKEFGKAMIGMMVGDSNGRLQSYIMHGCNAFHLKRPRSLPLAFWTEQDILQYHQRFGLPLASVYGQIVGSNGDLSLTGAQNTGCIFCGFGAHLEQKPNRFQRLRVTHPKLWQYCMDDLGMRNVLKFCGVEPGEQMWLF